jgi:hypothetical protein
MGNIPLACEHAEGLLGIGTFGCVEDERAWLSTVREIGRSLSSYLQKPPSVRARCDQLRVFIGALRWCPQSFDLLKCLFEAFVRLPAIEHGEPLLAARLAHLTVVVDQSVTFLFTQHVRERRADWSEEQAAEFKKSSKAAHRLAHRTDIKLAMKADCPVSAPYRKSLRAMAFAVWFRRLLVGHFLRQPPDLTEEARLEAVPGVPGPDITFTDSQEARKQARATASELQAETQRVGRLKKTASAALTKAFVERMVVKILAALRILIQSIFVEPKDGKVFVRHCGCIGGPLAVVSTSLFPVSLLCNAESASFPGSTYLAPRVANAAHGLGTAAGLACVRPDLSSTGVEMKHLLGRLFRIAVGADRIEGMTAYLCPQTEKQFNNKCRASIGGFPRSPIPSVRGPGSGRGAYRRRREQEEDLDDGSGPLPRERRAHAAEQAIQAAVCILASQGEALDVVGCTERINTEALRSVKLLRKNVQNGARLKQHLVSLVTLGLRDAGSANYLSMWRANQARQVFLRYCCCGCCW